MTSSEFERAMASLAAEHAAASAPASVERAVLAEFDASRRRRYFGMVAAAAVAATLGAGAALLRERPAPRPVVMTALAPLNRTAPPAPEAPPLKRRRRKRVVAQPPGSAEPPFITIPYTVPLAPEETVTIVRMTLSPSAMAVAGFPLPAIDLAAGTQADVLVGEDGRARAIRFLTNSNLR